MPYDQCTWEIDEIDIPYYENLKHLYWNHRYEPAGRWDRSRAAAAWESQAALGQPAQAFGVTGHS